MVEKALECIRVLDLSEGIAGSYCARLLGNMGAEIIKMEKPGEGDKTRKAGPFPEHVPHLEKSALFLHLNVNKKGITLNLETAAGRRILEQLAKDADVLVESFKPGSMAKWRLDYDHLSKSNPGLIITSITPFGQTGPYRDWKGPSSVLDAMGGHTYIQGDPGREPLRNIEGAGEYTGGVHGATATMGALHWQAETGEGQHIDLSLFECLAGLDFFRVPRWTHLHKDQVRRGGRYFTWPGKAYRSRDGWVSVAGVGPTGTLVPMYSVTQIPELLDPKYETPDQREGRVEELDALLGDWVKDHGKHEVFNELQQVRVQAGVCSEVSDLMTDPGYEARGFWVEVEHPEVGKLPYPGPFVLMSDTEWFTTRAPLLGEHNKAIYVGELGYSSEELTQFRQSGVI